MYATAQRVKDQCGAEAIHAFMYLHDRPEFPFPADPFEVPLRVPGRLVRKDVSLKLGGNDVRSYVDVVAPDGSWSDDLPSRLSGLRDEFASTPTPLTARVGPVIVIFNAVPALDTRDEYAVLLTAALRVMQ